MDHSATRATLLSLRRGFRAVKHGAYRQMGERAVRDALALEDRNPERVSELLERAKTMLAYAEAAR